ncbi:MAG: rod shape-determining protein [Clostridia bacterium]|nr:rod shape-determining protein [Clostridia bacterium]
MSKLFGVIDIGSNSVRLMLSNGSKTLFKSNEITRLAQGQGEDLMLTNEAIERTALAVFNFNRLAIEKGASTIYAFATASARKAPNKQALLDRINELCGVSVEIISGEQEAYLGALGALNGKDGVVIDVGGASTEITVNKNGKTIYSKSINVGSVFLTELFGQDSKRVDEYLKSALTEYGTINCENLSVYSIGGTATTVSAVIQELEPYDPTKTHGHYVDLISLKALKDKLYSLSEVEREKLKGLQPKRAKVIANGVAILVSVLEYANFNGFTTSENDNLEGYLIEKLKGNQ